MNQTSPLTQDLLDQLKSLTDAVTEGALVLSRRDQTALDPSPVQATDALDYLAIRELLGRQARTETGSRFIRAARSGTQLDLYEVPDTGTDVAVFTGFGLPSEVLPLVAVAKTNTTPAHHSVTLDQVLPTTVITRIEVRRGDGTPISLGPRLEAG